MALKKLKVDITDEALVAALQTLGEIAVKNATESMLGTSLRVEKAGYTILRNGEEVKPGETEKKRGEKHTPAEYKLIIKIKA